ncbi:MAG: hypothetical protein IT330_02085 [Anaerolineae bacterium]|nr:hypothetical protein [Anaerolineae bacterium]
MGKRVISYILIIIGVLLAAAAAFVDVGAISGLRGIFLGLTIVIAGAIFYRRGK